MENLINKNATNCLEMPSIITKAKLRAPSVPHIITWTFVIVIPAIWNLKEWQRANEKNAHQGHHKGNHVIIVSISKHTTKCITQTKDTYLSFFYINAPVYADISNTCRLSMATQMAHTHNTWRLGLVVTLGPWIHKTESTTVMLRQTLLGNIRRIFILRQTFLETI